MFQAAQIPFLKKQNPKREPRFETEPSSSLNDKIFIRIQVLAVTYFHGILFSLIKNSDFKNKK